MQIRLPYPPSINHYYRAWRNRVVISAAGVRYRRDVAAVTEGQQKLLGRLRLEMTVYPPDRRRRDMDNVLKATLDALQHAGLYDDDSQIDELIVKRGNKVIAGCLVVNLEEI